MALRIRLNLGLFDLVWLLHSRLARGYGVDSPLRDAGSVLTTTGVAVVHFGTAAAIRWSVSVVYFQLVVKAWAESEFGECDLGDQRRNMRIIKYAEQAAACPEKSTPDQLETWGEPSKLNPHKLP